MRAKRPPSKVKGRAATPKPRKSPRVGSLPPAATDDGRGLLAQGQSRQGSPARDPGKPRLSSVVSGEFGDHADRACRKWLTDLDGSKMGDHSPGRIESAVLLVVGRDAVLESVCIPDGADRFRFVGALRLLAHRLEKGMVDDD